MYLRLAGAATAVVALAACAGPGPAVSPAAHRPAGAVRPVDAPARTIAPIDPTHNLDCTHNAATGSPATVAVAMPGRDGYTAAGTARWMTSTFGTCAGYAWVELRLDVAKVRASDVCKQYDCAMTIGLSVPGVSVGVVGYRALIGAGAGVFTTTAVQTYGGPAWATGETYAQAFTPDRIWFSN